MKMEVWVDVVCPWCAIGRARLEKALADLPADEQPEIVWRAFELDPTLTRGETHSLRAWLADHSGVKPADVDQMWEMATEVAKKEGLTFDFPSVVHSSSFDALQLVLWAQEKGKGSEMLTRLQTAYFSQGQNLGDATVLSRLAGEIGLPAEEASQMLAEDNFALSVQFDQKEAVGMGIQGVPFFVIDEKYGISGAQPSEVIRKALHEAKVMEKRAKKGQNRTTSVLR